MRSSTARVCLRCMPMCYRSEWPRRSQCSLDRTGGLTIGQGPVVSAAGNEKAVQFLIRFQADIEAESSTGERSTHSGHSERSAQTFWLTARLADTQRTQRRLCGPPRLVCHSVNLDGTGLA
jgi:hypothetical protein